jgi:Ca2+-binding EF-hand superfamily protein
MDLEFTITENLHLNRNGQIMQIAYEFEEIYIVQADQTSSEAGAGIIRHNREKRNRLFDTTVTREQYQDLARRLKNPLSFDDFVTVLRPFIMGFYAADDLEKAFKTLDRDNSGSIPLTELGSFLPLLNDTIDNKALYEYVRKVDTDFNGKLNYFEFRSLVLRGIGRDIICNHI